MYIFDKGVELVEEDNVPFACTYFLEMSRNLRVLGRRPAL